MLVFEVCANSVESAVNAQNGGANRIELCSNLQVGGITPPFYTIKLCKDLLNIPVNVLIRPHKFSFTYSDNDFQEIIYDIEKCKEINVNGIVCGLLTADGNIDIEKTKKLVDLTYPLEFTFHRAFDYCEDPFQSLEDVISTGAKRILTSGGANKAIDGVKTIEKLIKQAANRIIIMPGSGINENNIVELYNTTHAKEYHFSALSTRPQLNFLYSHKQILQKEDYDEPICFSDVEKIQNTIQALKTFVYKNT